MGSVELRQLRKSYKDLEVVHGIDLHIEPGEFIVLVGPSGCGKSTTLRMIAGLEDISGGEVTIDGRVVNEVAPKDRDIAMVFQNYALYPHMSVEENMSFALKLKKKSPEDISRAVKDAADILGLQDFLLRRPNELSGGQRQRVAMGRAIVRQPKVFLFDEPLSNLDAKLRTQMRAEIKRLHYRMKTTIVYVTHDQVEAMTLADRIVIMNGGHIEQVGSPEEIYQNPKNTFVANFIGSPPMNLISNDDFYSQWKEKNLSEKLKNALSQQALVGVRPEHFSLQDDQGLPMGGEIEFVEPLGGETLIHLRAKAAGKDQSQRPEMLTARIPSTQIEKKLEVGDDLQLFVSPEKVFFFDQQTQESIH